MGVCLKRFGSLVTFDITEHLESGTSSSTAAKNRPMRVLLARNYPALFIKFIKDEYKCGLNERFNDFSDFLVSLAFCIAIDHFLDYSLLIYYKKYGE